jgi:hypothetical protein
MQRLCGSVILYGNIFAGVVGHECRGYQTYDCASGDIDRDRITRVVRGEQRGRDKGSRPVRDSLRSHRPPLNRLGQP